MTSTPALTSTDTRSPRRPRPVLALTVLAALALAACGTEKTSADGPQGSPADVAGVQSDAAFTEMLGDIAQQCPASAAPEGPPSGPAQPLPPGATAPTDAMEPVAPTAGPEVELNARDWCASNLHEERITQALTDLADPTPAEVRTVLNDLGYIDERIHGLERSGTTTRFFLDLRDQGGRLCLDGSAAGEDTVVDKCVAPATGPFKAAGREV
ncbi:hypothetical protein AB0G87_00765 [Streptomyces asoensis]|uniref:hypothetical protein n=1 Tax=Streptomyces asoensis TaxID=249586 RepID=UPI00340FDDB1